MEKRVKLKCWHCKMEYSLLREVQDKPRLVVCCPYCEYEGVADLAPYRTEVVDIIAGDDAHEQKISETLDLSLVLPTAPREE